MTTPDTFRIARLTAALSRVEVCERELERAKADLRLAVSDAMGPSPEGGVPVTGLVSRPRLEARGA